MSIAIRPLTSVPLAILVHSWNTAFSDYKVSLPMTPALLGSVFSQNAVQLAMSLGAYDGSKLVGLWMNGVRSINGVPTAYDSGTAIWPEYRSAGISKLLSQASDDLLKGAGIKTYYLEVLQDNERAFGIYKKGGFEVTRKLTSFKATPILFDESSLQSLSLEVRGLSEALYRDLPKMEYEPSWQNKLPAMLAISELVNVVLAKKGGAIVGWGIVQPGRARISQFSFANSHWTDQTPRLVFGKMMSLLASSSEVLIINVDDAATKSIALLKDELHFESPFSQYEMRKDL